MLLLLVLGWGWHWRTHPTALPDAVFATGSTRFPPGSTHFAGVVSALADADSVRIDRIAAVVTTNTADADVRFLVCTVDPAGGAGGVGLIREKDFARTCPDPVPAEGGAVLTPEAGRHQDVVMAVTPRRRGDVRIEALQVTYRHGWQRGTQTIAVGFVGRG